MGCTPRLNPHHNATNRNSPLHFRSCHPRHLRENLACGQLLRDKCNSSRVEDYYRESAHLETQLLQHRYPDDVIEGAKVRAENHDQGTLLADHQGNNRQV